MATVDKGPEPLAPDVPKDETLDILADATSWLQRRDAVIKRGIYDVTDFDVNDKRYREFWLTYNGNLEWDNVIASATTAELLELKADADDTEAELKAMAKAIADMKEEAMSHVAKRSDSEDAQIQEILEHVKECGMLPRFCEVLEDEVTASIPFYRDFWQRLNEMDAELQTLFDNKAAYTEKIVRSQHKTAADHWLHKVSGQLHRELGQKLDSAILESEQCKELALRSLELTSALERKTQELEHAQERCDEQQNQILDMQTKLETARDESRSLGKQLDEAQRETLVRVTAVADDNANQAAKDALTTLNTQLQAKETEIANLRKDVEDRIDKQATLATELESANRGKAGAEAQQNLLVKDNTSVGKENVRLKEKIEGLISQVADMNDIRSRLESEKEAVVRLQADLAKSKTTASGEKKQLEWQKAEVEGHKAELQKRYDDMQHAFNRLQEQCTSKSTVNEQLRIETAGLHETLQRSNMELQALHEGNTTLTADVASRKTRIASLEENLATVQTSLQTGEEVKTAVGRLSESMQKMNEQLNTVQDANSRLQINVKEAKEETARLREAENSKTMSLAKVEAELESVRQSLEEQKSRNENLRVKHAEDLSKKLSEQSEKDAQLHKKNLDAALAERAKETDNVITAKKRQVLEDLAEQRRQLEEEHNRNFKAERATLQKDFEKRRADDVTAARNEWEEKHKEQDLERDAQHKQALADAVDEADHRERRANMDAHKDKQEMIKALNAKHADTMRLLVTDNQDLANTRAELTLLNMQAQTESLEDQIKDLKRQVRNEQGYAKRSQKHISRLLGENRDAQWKNREDIKRRCVLHINAVAEKARFDVEKMQIQIDQDEERYRLQSEAAANTAELKVRNANEAKQYIETELADVKQQLAEARHIQSRLNQFASGFGVISRILTEAPTLTFAMATQAVEAFIDDFPNHKLVVLDCRWCALPADQLIIMDVDHGQFMWLHGNGCMLVNCFANARIGNMYHSESKPITCITFQVFHERWYVPISLQGKFNSVITRVINNFCDVFEDDEVFNEYPTSIKELMMAEGKIKMVVVDQRVNPRTELSL